ncbi:4F2 cell-surface antigen heavy chain-like [Fundulus heteroclitus]|uniref:4F2 cell-surface antigen heavy chain-like n=1 Tax=Fundulus heteroclitus TaxID=8078 RepID=UPI00165AECA6|nr:4F2 cell-surface antigen heavy chain-like [Fundulus heteroclitus]
MSKDTEIDMEEETWRRLLLQVDLEKQPLTGDGPAPAGEKNGSVKLKVPDVAFTGLSKEELMKVAGTPRRPPHNRVSSAAFACRWVLTHWMLLVLFWLGWVGMLAEAIVIIVQAPRCKPVPEMNWWNNGPLYQVSDLEAFCGGMEGLEAKLEQLAQIKVKGLVLGPFHRVQRDHYYTLDFKIIDPIFGTNDILNAVLKKAEKKDISVVLDLTPNYKGSSPWFSSDNEIVMEKLKVAAQYWMGRGVNGIKVPDMELASGFSGWSSLSAAIHSNGTADDKKKMALMGVVDGLSAVQVSDLVNTTDVDLVLPDLLSTKRDGVERIKAVDALSSQQRSVGWGLGASKLEPLSKVATSPDLRRLYQLLLFTLPGTPVFTYGDEIGLLPTNVSSYMMGLDKVPPKMIWDTEESIADEAADANRTERIDLRSWFKSLSDLRGKERSLLYGDYYPLESSASSLAFLRVWDQSERYITAVNWGKEPSKLKLTLPPTASTEGVVLPKMAKVKLSTDANMTAESSVSLESVSLGPEKAVLLQFPLVV